MVESGARSGSVKTLCMKRSNRHRLIRSHGPSCAAVGTKIESLF